MMEDKLVIIMVKWNLVFCLINVCWNCYCVFKGLVGLGKFVNIVQDFVKKLLDMWYKGVMFLVVRKIDDMN